MKKRKRSLRAGVRTFQSVAKEVLCQQGHLRFFHASPASAGAMGALWRAADALRRVGKPALLNPVNAYEKRILAGGNGQINVVPAPTDRNVIFPDSLCQDAGDVVTLYCRLNIQYSICKADHPPLRGGIEQWVGTINVMACLLT